MENLRPAVVSIADLSREVMQRNAKTRIQHFTIIPITNKVLYIEEPSFLSSYKIIKVTPCKITSLTAILVEDLEDWIKVVLHTSFVYDKITGDKIICGEGAMK